MVGRNRCPWINGWVALGTLDVFFFSMFFLQSVGLAQMILCMLLYAGSGVVGQTNMIEETISGISGILPDTI